MEAKLRPEDEVEDGTFNTHLPLLLIDTNDVVIPGEIMRDPETGAHVVDENGLDLYTQAEDGSKTIQATIHVIDHNKKVNRPEDKPDLTSDVRIRIRGNSSRAFDKKNYLLQLVDSKGENRDEALLGMDAHHSWALHGPYLDKTMIRNYMWYNISGEIMGYAPNVRFCEVMVNGEYKGLYVLTETITKGIDGSRLPLTVTKKSNMFSGYVLRLDRTNDEAKKLNSFSGYTYKREHTLEVEFPGKDIISDSIKETIRQDFSVFEKSLYSYDFDNDKYGYRDYIDTQSFVDYLIVNEFTCNYDAGWLSTYIYKDRDGRLYMCVWDFNASCDNYRNSVFAMDSASQHFEFQNILWYNMLIKDDYFTDYISKRYRDLRTTYLDTEYLQQYMDDVIAYLGPAIERNFDVWGYTFNEEADMLDPPARNPRDYESAVKEMKDFIQMRGEWMDRNIDALKQYSNEAKIKKFNEKAN